MIEKYLSGPIIACCSGTSHNVAISVIRISGYISLDIFQKSFSINLSDLKPRSMVNADLLENDNIIDSILFCYFKNPHSYTGENVVEIFAHGNVLNVKKIIRHFVNFYNIREAEAGEFTFRAFKNKKLKLDQVEGLNLFLNGLNGYVIDQGISLLNGELHDKFLFIHKNFINIKSSLELLIDFSEDVSENEAKNSLIKHTDSILKLLSPLVKSAENFSDGILSLEIILFGPPNAGKSSLFNNLLSKKRSIVSNIAGTTRDFISENILISDVVFKLIDTAGLNPLTTDPIEKEGIKLALDKIKHSYIKVLVINHLDKKLVSEYENLSPDFIIYTHVNENDKNFSCKIGNEFYVDNLNFGSIEPKINTSILSKYNLDIKNQPLITTRHRKIINELYLYLSEFRVSICENNDLGVIAYNLGTIEHLINELLGVITSDETLNNIFDNFCIGK